MTEIRLGMIGVGGFGLFCLQQYRQMPGVRITAIAGTKPEKYARLADEYNIPFHTTNWRELATHPGVDIVHLATPPNLRVEYAVTAMDAGKHVFCEKPLAITLEEADLMLAAAQRNHVRLGINFVMRYSALYDLTRRIIEERLLGEPQRFLFENTAGDLPRQHWFWDPAQSGTIPVEHGVHFFDIFSSLFGPGMLQWAGRTMRPTGEEDKWLSVLRYGDQMFGSYYHAFDKPSAIEQTWAVLDFTRGYLRLDGWIPTDLMLDGLVEHPSAQRFTELFPDAEVTPEAKMELRSNGQAISATHRVRAASPAADKQAIYAQAVRDALADFIAWTRNPSYIPRVTGEDGRAALATAVAVRALARGA